MKRLYQRLNRAPWPIRWSIKSAIFVIISFFVCFPYPIRFVTHVQRWRNPNALIEPQSPALDALFQELQPSLDSEKDDAKILALVERFVYSKIEYAWDWDTWGMADYIPTVAEAVEQGHEDCDGRAVVAASILARLGYHSELVTDFTHVWVKTNKGELMGPGSGAAVVINDDGVTIAPDAAGLALIALSYGVAVFPLGRELILLFTIWLLIARLPGRLIQAGFALGLMIAGLVLLRKGGLYPRNPQLLLQIAGLVILIIGSAWSWNPFSKSRHTVDSPVDLPESPIA